MDLTLDHPVNQLIPCCFTLQSSGPCCLKYPWTYRFMLLYHPVLTLTILFSQTFLVQCVQTPKLRKSLVLDLRSLLPDQKAAHHVWFSLWSYLRVLQSNEKRKTSNSLVMRCSEDLHLVSDWESWQKSYQSREEETVSELSHRQIHKVFFFSVVFKTLCRIFPVKRPFIFWIRPEGKHLSAAASSSLMQVHGQTNFYPGFIPASKNTPVFFFFLIY